MLQTRRRISKENRGSKRQVAISMQKIQKEVYNRAKLQWGG